MRPRDIQEIIGSASEKKSTFLDDDVKSYPYIAALIPQNHLECIIVIWIFLKIFLSFSFQNKFLMSRRKKHIFLSYNTFTLYVAIKHTNSFNSIVKLLHGCNKSC